MTRLLALGTVLVAVVVAPPVRAQSTPEAAAMAMGNAISRSDWAAAARLMHPDAIRQLRELFRPFVEAPGMEELGPQVFDTPTAELNALPDTVLYARFLGKVMGQLPGMSEALRNSRFTPLGHVAGGADTVLVVSRMEMTIEGMTISQFDVMPFRRENGTWWGLLKSDFTNMAAMLRRAADVPPVEWN